MSESANPLLSEDLLNFSALDATQIAPALTTVLNAYETLLHTIATHDTHVPWTWQTLMVPMVALDVQLGRIWAHVSHLNAVCSSDAWREVYMAQLERLSLFYAELGQNQAIYHATQSLTTLPEYDTYSAAQKQVIAHQLRDAKLSGVALPVDQRQAFIALQAKLSGLSQTFENHVLDASDAWFLDGTDLADLAGMPEADLAVAKSAAPEGQAYRLKLKPNMVQAVLNHVHNRAIRQQLYHAWVTRASDVGPHAGQYDNGPIMSELLQAKTQQAKMLGYPHYAAVSLVPKMANSPEQIIAFLERLGQRALPYAQKEKADLEAFAAEHLGLTELQPWDLGFASEALQQHAYEVSSKEVRAYFALDKVMAGLFTLCQTLFGVVFEEDASIVCWHETVQAFRLYDAQGQALGVLYVDLFSREKKRGGAWMNNAQDRVQTQNGTMQPWVFLTCNFTPPVDGTPTQLNHDDVVTLFHEMGHCLHCLLTEIDVYGVSGISGVAWDAVELPSQMLEHWCWQPAMLDQLTAHHQTQAPMPKDLQQKLIRTRHFQAGMQLLRQVQFALFDMHLHARDTAFSVSDIQRTLTDVQAEFSVFPAYPEQRFAHSFSHIFGGGYAAGYYSYLWAQVLASDVFAAFEEEGLFEAQVGQRYVRTILSQGGSVEMQDAFQAFRGRQPDECHLLRHLGLDDVAATEVTS